MTTSPRFQRLFKSPQLPSVPAVALRLLDLAQDLDSSTKDIVQTIKSDPALAAKILRSANSSYFSFRSEVKTLEQAVPLIGRTVITTLAISFTLASETMSDGPLAAHYRRYWLQSIVQASAGEILGRHVSKGLATELFMTGLLIDIGQLAMLKTLAAEYVPVIEQLQSGTEPLHVVESRELGFNHIDVGTELMKKWKLADSMIEATLRHHADPADVSEDRDDAGLIHMMMIAASVGEYFCNGTPGETLERLRDLTGRYLDFDKSQLKSFLDETDVRIKETADLLNTNTDDLPEPADLMAQACEQLAELSIQQDKAKREADSRQQVAELEKLQLENQNEKLREQVFRDALTGLYNRRFFDETLSNEVRHATRKGTPIGLLFVDADHFKRLNDTHGHQFGDAVLMRIGQVMSECVRSSDIAARYGGEEFVVLALDTNETGLKILAERIRHAVETEEIRRGGVRVPVTISVGGALSIPQRDEQNLAAQLIEASDAAMYESKRRGRNCITVHSMVSDLERRVSRLVLKYRFSHWLVENRVVESNSLFELSQSARPENAHVGELAFQHDWMGLADVQRVLDTQNQTGERFGVIAHRLGLLSAHQLAALLSEQAEVPQRLADQLVKSKIVDRREADLLLQCFVDDCKRIETEFPVDSPALAGQDVSC